MEIGQRLHFHGVSDSGVNFQTELYTTAANNLILAAGGFNCSSVSASSLRAPLLKNNVIGNFIYRNSANAALMTIKHTGAVEFAGEISTPTWSSTSPVISNHNSLSNLQGGQSNNYYHLTANEHTYLTSFLENGSNSLTTNTVYATNYNVGDSVLTYPEDKYDTEDNVLSILHTTIHGVELMSLFALKTTTNTVIGNSIDLNGITTIYGNLIVQGEITTPSWASSGGSNTITHLTQSTDPTLEGGVFVETTGGKYYQPDFIDKNGVAIPKNLYENCICKVKRANSLNKNIVGVLTSVNPLKFATHGDVLIKFISDTYQLGDVLIPTIDGYGKKATGGEIHDSLYMMIPRAKITGLLTNIHNTVSAILL